MDAPNLPHGTEVLVTFAGDTQVRPAIIGLEEGSTYYCSDDPYFQGEQISPELGHGKQYSWIHDDAVAWVTPVPIAPIQTPTPTFRFAERKS